MRKQEFLDALMRSLSGLPKQDIEERISFYGEMIDDRMEEGCKEEQAVAQIGSVDEVVAQILAEVPLIKIAKERMKPKKRLRAWEIVLLAVGSPIWLSLGVAAFAVILALYAVAWSVIVSLWAVFASVVGCAFGGAVAGILFAIGKGPVGIALLGAAAFCAGLAILSWFGCRAATKGILHLTGMLILGMKKRLTRKEEAQ